MCSAEADCGFMKWLWAERPHLAAKGCGKDPRGCGRLDERVPHPLDQYGPATMDEGAYAFPRIPNTNGRPERTGTGGCAVWGDYEPDYES